MRDGRREKGVIYILAGMVCNQLHGVLLIHECHDYGPVNHPSPIAKSWDIQRKFQKAIAMDLLGWRMILILFDGKALVF